MVELFGTHTNSATANKPEVRSSVVPGEITPAMPSSQRPMSSAFDPSVAGLLVDSARWLALVRLSATWPTHRRFSPRPTNMAARYTSGGTTYFVDRDHLLGHRGAPTSPTRVRAEDQRVVLELLGQVGIGQGGWWMIVWTWSEYANANTMRIASSTPTRMRRFPSMLATTVAITLASVLVSLTRALPTMARSMTRMIRRSGLVSQSRSGGG